jgi:hypothetical protein
MTLASSMNNPFARSYPKKSPPLMGAGKFGSLQLTDKILLKRLKK